MTTRYLIVGSSVAGIAVAGIAAAEAIRRHDPGGKITLLSDDRHGYYSRPGLAYLLTGEIPEVQLFPLKPAALHELGLRRAAGVAARLEPLAHRVILADGASLAYDRLLLATGALATPSPVPRAELPGVIKLDGPEDARQLLHLARRARAAVVIGGGITALEIADGLHARCCPVHYLLRSERHWGSVLDATESEIIVTRLAAAGIQLHTRTEVVEIIGQRGRVAGVLTTDGRRIACGLHLGSAKPSGRQRTPLGSASRSGGGTSSERAG